MDGWTPCAIIMITTGRGSAEWINIEQKYRIPWLMTFIVSVTKSIKHCLFRH